MYHKIDTSDSFDRRTYLFAAVSSILKKPTILKKKPTEDYDGVEISSVWSCHAFKLGSAWSVHNLLLHAHVAVLELV